MGIFHSDVMDIFHEWYYNRHEYAKRWKERTGRPIFGTFCTYVPEEMLYAAGILPVRILGSHEIQDVTEPFIFGMFCPFCRDALAQGLKGRYEYLDGIVIAQSCLHFRQTFNTWRSHIPVKYAYYLPMPNEVQSPFSRVYLKGELERFKRFIEEEVGRKIERDRLRDAVMLLNRNRNLLRKIYEFRKEKHPPVTGLECMFMAITSQFIDKEEHTRALEEVLKVLPERRIDRKTGIRLMTVGSENDDAEFLKMIESLGATIVIDEQCAGSRYFWNPVDISDDIMQSIADRYIDRPPCPTKDYPARNRFQHILKLAKDYNVQGAIIIQQKFCDPHEGDNPVLKNFLQENGIPSILLEFDSINPLGPFRVRVEAFLETLGGIDLFDEGLF